MTLSDLSIKRPVFAWMLMAGLIVFGIISVLRLGISQIPDVDFPMLTITANWEGAAPEIMESGIVDKLEQAVISVQGIRDITSNMRQGTATITLEFELSRDIDAALQEVQSNISRVKLPKDVDPPTIMKTNPDDQPIMYVGVTSNKRSLHDLIAYIDLHLRDQFQILPGVGEILLSGFSDRNLRVWIDNEKLKQYELSIPDIQQALALEHVEIAAGYMENDRNEINVRVMGEGRTAEEVGNIPIKQRGGQPIYDSKISIKDVARVEDGLNDVRRISRIFERAAGVDGVPGVGLGIKKLRGSNAVAVARGVKARMKELNKTLPKDIHLALNFDSTRFIEDSVHETVFTLVLSALVTGLVCFLFLGSWSSTLNVLLSIPTSVIGSFMVLYFMGFTLNMFTLLGLSLAIGIVVDDAIMVLENIFRHLEMKKDRINAARDGAREITFAAIAASAAVIAIFLPVAFMKGIIGKFFFQFGVTISGAVALSLLEAITLTPMRASQFMGDAQRTGRFARFTDRQFQKLSNFYRRILTHALDNRWKVILLSLLIFILSLGFATGIRIPGTRYKLLKPLNAEFIPPQDQSMFLMIMETPVGSSMKFTSDCLAQAEKLLKSRPEVCMYFSVVGGFMGGESNKAFIFVTMTPESRHRPGFSGLLNGFEQGIAKIPGLNSLFHFNPPLLGQYELMDWCRTSMAKIPGFGMVYAQDFSMRGLTTKRGLQIEFNVRGEDYKVLKQKSDELIAKLNATGLFQDLNTDYREGMPEVRIWPDREKAARSGVSMQTIGDTINGSIGGLRQGEFTNGDRRYDVRMRLEPEERLNPESILQLQVRTQYGELIPVSQVVHTETVPTLQTITRIMRERAISISSNVASGKSQETAVNTVIETARKILPEGYRIFLSGSSQASRESFESLIFAMVMGIIIAYMVLASQFNSFLHPFTVLLALPFSLTGALIALWLTDQSINLYSMIGMVLLMGIVKKNSILLVEFTNKKRYEERMPLREAILTAGPIRLRPILMTSAASIAAALPPALALGPGGESRIPMAVTVIGGVFVSTLLTLLVVPCAYSLLARFERLKTTH